MTFGVHFPLEIQDSSHLGPLKQSAYARLVNCSFQWLTIVVALYSNENIIGSCVMERCVGHYALATCKGGVVGGGWLDPFLSPGHILEVYNSSVGGISIRKPNRVLKDLGICGNLRPWALEKVLEHEGLVFERNKVSKRIPLQLSIGLILIMWLEKMRYKSKYKLNTRKNMDIQESQRKTGISLQARLKQLRSRIHVSTCHLGLTCQKIFTVHELANAPVSHSSEKLTQVCMFDILMYILHLLISGQTLRDGKPRN